MNMNRTNSWHRWMALALGVANGLNAWAQVDVLTYHYDFGRTGQNTNEVQLTPSNVNINTFGKLFSYTVDGHVYAQPLLVSGVNIPGKGTHNVVFVVTQHDSVYAFDAESNSGPDGGLLWQVSMGASSPMPNSLFGNRYGPYHDIDPEVGITSTPVIDGVSGTLYLDAFTVDSPGVYNHRIHALDITTGIERPGSPVVVSATVLGLGVSSGEGRLSFIPTQHLQRPALALSGGMVFVAYSGYADTDPYHGWVLGFNATNLQAASGYVFCDTPNATVAQWGPNAGEAGIWMAGNGPAVDATGNLFFTTGNGSFNANTAGGTEYGDTFVKLSTTGRLAVADYFTPYNQAGLSGGDTDLGSGGIALLPDGVGSVAHPHLIVGCGKEGRVYLVDRDKMGHYNPTSDNGLVVQELPGAVGGTWSSPAYFNGLIYYQGSGDVMKAFRISNATLSASPVTQSTTAFGYPGGTPTISAHGTNAAIAWVIQSDGYPGANAVLHAYNATNLAVELYNSSLAGDRDLPGNAVKYTLPVVANGKVYLGAQDQVDIYGLSSFLAAPTINPPGGLFTNSAIVTLSEGAAGSAIYYTLDGSTPTSGASSLLYSAPFKVTNSTLVLARAFATGSTPSPVASATFVNSASVVISKGFAKQEFYSGALRTDLENPGFPSAPTFSAYLPSFETPMGQGVNYAERVSGWFNAPQTGNYVFFVCSDDDSDLFLSTDSTPGNLKLIAQETSWSNAREWVSSAGGSTVSSKRSDEFAGTEWPTGNAIKLVGGRSYYLVGIHHQGQGGDDFAATYKMSADPDPNDGDAPQLTGNAVSAEALKGAAVSISGQPQDTLAVQGGNAIFAVVAQSVITNPAAGSGPLPLEYQWQTAFRAGAAFVNIPGAFSGSYTSSAVALTDNGRLFRALISTPGASVTSSVAVLSVAPDLTPPVPVRVVAVDPTLTIITVAFNKALYAASVVPGADYQFSPGSITAVSGALDATGTILTVTAASPLKAGVAQTLTFTGITDTAGNSIPAGASISFTVAPAAYAQVVLSDSPVAYFGFEETSGVSVATNSVPGGVNGAYDAGDEMSPGSGGAASTAAGDPGPRPPAFAGFPTNNRSATFDGATRWVDTRVQYLQDAPSFTLEYWVSTKNRAQWADRIGVVGENDAVEHGFISPNVIETWTPNGGALDLPYTYPDGEWHHVVTVADGNSISLYYDGVLQGSETMPTGDYGNSPYFTHIGGGGVQDPTGNYFTGHIDEVAVYRTPLSPQRVAAHFSAGKLGGSAIVPGDVSPVELKFTAIRSASGLIALEWLGQATLQEGPTVDGPWTPAANQSNPQVVPISLTTFYRLHQ